MLESKIRISKRAPDIYLNQCCRVIHKQLENNYSGIPFQINFFILENKLKHILANICQGGVLGSEEI